jgi:hypothetical protein
MIPGFPARGARIQSVRPGRRDELAIETYEPGAGLRRWDVSADPEDARWLETFDRPVGRAPAAAERIAGIATPFALLARARLEGARVLGMGHPQPGMVRLDAETPEGAVGVVLELTRPRPELLLLGAADTVLGSLRAHREVAALGGRRNLDAGQPYLPPADPRTFGPEPARSPPESQDAARALHATWRERLAAHDLQRARTEASRELRQALRRLERRMEHLAVDLQAAGEAETFRRWGELLKIHGAQAVREHPGVREVRVPDEFSAERTEVSIPVDPAVPLAGNIAGLFRQYRKRRDAAQHVARRIAQTETALAAARSLAQAVEAATAAGEIEQALRAWRGTPRPGYGADTRRTAPPATRRAAPAATRRARRGEPAVPRAVERTSSDGLPILVGRSAAGNDALTFRVAKGRDWWLHALGFPGSHVIVRHGAGGPLPAATLREAAWLAAYYSKARRQGQVEVAYVERKHVRRVPKGPPGQVTYSHGHTLWVDVGDARLKRILDIQPEDESE